MDKGTVVEYKHEGKKLEGVVSWTGTLTFGSEEKYALLFINGAVYGFGPPVQVLANVKDVKVLHTSCGMEA
jgi:hypothetical protein